MNFFAMAQGLPETPDANAPQPAIFYDRVSTDKQDVERQQRMLLEYRQRLNLRPILVASDPDTSGFKVPFAQREGGRTVLDFIAQGVPTGTVFVTTEQDRVGRDTPDVIATIRAIWNAGIVPHFIANGGALPRTPDNEFRMELNASFAQLERHRLAGRIQSKISGKRAAGELCGQLSYGFNAEYRFRDGTLQTLTSHALTKTERAAQELIHGPVVSQMLVPNPKERHWLRKMHELRTAGWGYHSIARHLNEHKVPTKRSGEVMRLRTAAGTATKANSGKWNCGQIKNVLESKTAQQILAEH